MPLTETEKRERVQAQRERDEQQEAQRIARDLTSFLNVMCGDERRIGLIVSELAREHRTLQQKVTGVAVGWLVHLAELPEDRYDLRNEASVKLARKLLDGTDKYDRGLPTI
jgi:hypothetical protein